MGINLNVTDGCVELDDVGGVTPHQQSCFTQNLACLFHHVSATSLLCHSRDVHPTWVKLFTETLSNNGLGVLSTRAKSEGDFDSY